MSDQIKGQITHDINSALSALLSAFEMSRDEWKSNPELVEKILPLTHAKINELQSHLERYKNLNLD